MDLAAVALISSGIIAIVVGAVQIRGPRATIRQLDETAANLDRYEAWRGKRTSLADDGPTGADEMRAQMRRRMMLWGTAIVVGAVLVVAGLVVS